MLLRNWFESLKTSRGLNSLNHRRRGRLRRRVDRPGFQAAEVEILEQRRLLSAGGNAAQTASAPVSVTTIDVTSLADSGKNTLRDAILRADKGKSTANYEIDILVPNTIVLESQLPDLSNAITIKGLGVGHTVIQRDTLAAPFRILTVDAGQTATLTGLGIAQGNAGTGAGGAIDNFGNLTLSNCVLSQNTADQGGAIANEVGASLTVSGVSFATNHAANNNANRGGGAIWNNGLLTVQSNSSFDANTAVRDAAAIFNLGVATVSQTAFTNNVAQGSAGAIESYPSAKLTVNSGTHFAGNSAGYIGGAIFSYGKLDINGASFDNNSAQYGGGVFTATGAATISGSTFGAVGANTASVAGGAIGNEATVTVAQTSFVNNSSAYGGAIENYSGANLTVNPGASFTGNNTTIGGGAINNNGTLVASGATFTNNTSVGGGGIATDGSATISGCTFSANHATDPNSNQGGGAIWNNGSLTVQANSTFLGNTAVRDAAAILNLNSGVATVAQASFTNNVAQGSAGAIESYPSAKLTVNAGTHFTGNSAGYIGGAIFSYGTLDVNGASFDNNSAQYGGGVFTATGTTTISGSSFGSVHANTASVTGGAIASEAAVIVAQTSFNSNTSAFGGAIQNYAGANLTINSGSSFTDNSSTVGGGAINNNGTLVASGATFTGNTSVDGGAIATDGSATVSGCTFNTNHATDTAYSRGGGAIWNNGSLTVQSASNFAGNTAANSGGAILNLAFATVTQTSFTNNSAALLGGAIENAAGANLTVSPGSLFTGNSAVNSGGAICNLGIMYVYGAAFSSNMAEFGGAIENNVATATVAQTSFMNNSSPEFGGAIYNNGGSLDVFGCEFESNAAVIGGGAIANGFGVLTVSSCVLDGNTAAFGGAIINGGGVLTVSGCTIEFNTATVGGGIFTEQGGQTYVYDSVVNNNTPDDTHTVAGSTLFVSGSIIGLET